MLKVADGGPSQGAIESNAYGLAAYAKIAQVSSAHFPTTSPLLKPSKLLPEHVLYYAVLYNPDDHLHAWLTSVVTVPGNLQVHRLISES